MRSLLFFIILMTSMSDGAFALEPQSSAPAKPTTAGQGVKPTQPTAVKPNLSESECTSHAGKLTNVSAAICMSGTICITTDQNKVEHGVCIDKAQ